MRRGIVTRGKSAREIAELALHSTSDFPAILANVANKTLRAAYEAAPQTFRPIVRVTFHPDFKGVTRAQLGDAPSLEKVNRAGEFKRGTIADGKETFALASYGKILGFTRQSVINDDLDALTRLPMLFGRAAADLESDLVWAQITANGLMGDGIALFDVNTHKNYVSTSGATISDTTLNLARIAMRTQKGLNGRYLNLTPKFCLVPVAKETVAKRYFATEVRPDKADNVNPFAGTMEVIAEPRLDAAGTNPWYVAASPDQVDIIELAYLQDQQGVYLETRQGFDVDGMELKARLDVAAKVIDYRGLYCNAGA
jgi:phage major head subunit gpT-like protein